MSNCKGPNNNNNISKGSSEVRKTLSTTRGYLTLIPPLSKVEFDLLKQSIKEEGMHLPIIVNKQGVVLDGHHRFRACKELGIPLQYLIKEFKDPLEEKQYLIVVNLRRRQLNVFQKVEIGYSLENIEKERAKRRMCLSGQMVGLATKKENHDNNNEVELPLIHVRRKEKYLR